MIQAIKKFKSAFVISLDPTVATTLTLPCEKKPAQPTEPIKVIIIATTITLVTFPVNPSLMVCIPDIVCN